MFIDSKVETIKLIEQVANIKYSEELNEYFSTFCLELSYLIDFVRIFRDTPKKMKVVVIDKNEKSLINIKNEVEPPLKLLNNYDYIPYINYSFKTPVQLNGAFLSQNVFMLFFTKHESFMESENMILQSLYKFETKLKILI